MSLFGCAKALNEGLFHVVVLGLATYLAVNEQISFGDILIFSVLFLNVMTPLNEIHRVIDEGHEASLRVGELIDMLRQPVDRSFRKEHVENIELGLDNPASKSMIVLDYVTPDGNSGEPQWYVAANQHGETIGVAGPSGPGNRPGSRPCCDSSIPLAAQSGWVESPWTTSAAGSGGAVGYVGQNPFVFSGTVSENISYGNGAVSTNGFTRAAELANLLQEILQMPQGSRPR